LVGNNFCSPLNYCPKSSFLNLSFKSIYPDIVLVLPSLPSLPSFLDVSLNYIIVLFLPSRMASSLASMFFIRTDSVWPASLDEKCLGFLEAFSLLLSSIYFLCALNFSSSNTLVLFFSLEYISTSFANCSSIKYSN